MLSEIKIQARDYLKRKIKISFLLPALLFSYQAWSSSDIENVLNSYENGQEIKQALEPFSYSYDPFEKGITFYLTPTGGSNLALMGFIGESSADTELALSANYQGDGWIYAEDVLVLIDGDVWRRDNVPFQRDAISGSTVLEMGIMPMDQEIEELVSSMSSANEVIVRISGRGQHDFTAKKDAIENIFRLVNALGSS